MWSSEEKGLIVSTSVIANAPVAFEIVDDLLTKTGNSMAENDFDSFAECIALPYVVETFEGELRVTNLDMMRRMFDHNVAYYRQTGIRRIERRCTMAEYQRHDHIACTYETMLIDAEDQMVRAPYVAYCMLRNIEGVWLATHAQYAISDSSDHCSALVMTLKG